MRYTLILIGCIFLVACGGDDVFCPPELCECPDPVPEPSETPTLPPIEPTPIKPTPTQPPPSGNPRCNGVMGVDGPGKFLWKPKSDPTSATPNRLVVLLPARFSKKFESVRVVRNDGRTETLRYTGRSNGDRQTWRAAKSGGSYNGTLTAFDTDQECTWKVNSPGQRQD